ncbi:penicillin acylase family protein [Geodermatophilus sp. URMC 61]|uniref:penicillin acylase family protein n=1 Tax=Geodermatophilus sp. URMC 61 TaxID=3423411 RepID=UPI00406BE81F
MNRPARPRRTPRRCRAWAGPPGCATSRPAGNRWTAPDHRTHLADTFVQTGGATFRIVVDVGDWDGSLVMNSPGQSGAPDSPHYADLFEAWSRGEAFPLCYSRARVEAVTERRIRLRPPGGPAEPDS